jgi:hypothetical protein
MEEKSMLCRFGVAAVLLAAVFACGSVPAFAVHPLITDDANTLGKGNVQLELNGEYGHEPEDGVTTNTTRIFPVLTYGIKENIDVVLGAPYQYIRTKGADSVFNEDGLADTSLEVKWRFYDKDGLALAVKPGVSLPTGDRKRGLGAGRTRYGVFLIGTQELKPASFHANLGYIRNENRNDERRDIWHASLASEVEVVKDLRFVTNIGVESNTDKQSDVAPAFLIGGFIYTISEHVYVDAGYKYGLNKPETDSTILAGITFGF